MAIIYFFGFNKNKTDATKLAQTKTIDTSKNNSNAVSSHKKEPIKKIEVKHEKPNNNIANSQTQIKGKEDISKRF